MDYRRKGFEDQLIKLGFFGLLSKMMPSVVKGVSNLAKWAPKAYQSGGVLGAQNLKSMPSKVRGFEGLAKRPWLGVTKKPVRGVIGEGDMGAKFLENPLRWLAKKPKEIIGRTAQNVMDIKDVGALEALVGSPLRRASLFYKHPAPGMTTVHSRSLLGKGLSIGGTTGVGFAGMAALPKTDMHGQPRSVAQRLGSGAKEWMWWGSPVRPITQAKFTAYDLPKEVINVFKKKPNLGEIPDVQTYGV